MDLRMYAKRIDPAGCGCTDCLTGDSKPLDEATDDDMRRLVKGRVTDATSTDLEVCKVSRFRDGVMIDLGMRVKAQFGTSRVWEWEF